MKLSKTFALGCIIGFMSCVSFQQAAIAAELPEQQVKKILVGLDSQQKKIVEMVAADFFNEGLSKSQQKRILLTQAEKYQNGDASSKNSMRQKRRIEWRAKSEQERGLAHFSKGAGYYSLTEAQKIPFRLYAIDQLGLRPAVQYEQVSRGSEI